MSCYHPIAAWKPRAGGQVLFAARGDSDRIDIPCGQCLGCRLRRSRDWSVRVMHESKLYDENCFVTLTYGRDACPPDMSLCYRDYQLFMKRLRSRTGRPVRFFMCGEYGPLNLRPHYHACLFNIDFHDKKPAGKSGAGAVFYDSPLLREIWSHGHVSVQPLTIQSAAYCARYVVDKVTGDAAKHHYNSVDADGVIRSRTPEFSRCSLKPGIGARWFERYRSDVFGQDFCVLDGQKVQVPRYYDRLEKKYGDVSWDEFEHARQLRGRAGRADQTPERLAVREVVHAARVRNQRRSLE